MSTLNLEVPLEPKELKKEVLKRINSPKSAFLSKRVVYNSIVLGSGGLPKYSWNMWRPKLKSAAMRVFREMLEDTGGRIVLPGRRRPRVKNLQRLYGIYTRNRTKEREELAKLFDLASWGARNVEPFSRELRKINVKDDEKFVDAVKRLVLEYNIPEMVASYRKRMEESGERALEPHIVAGLLFLPDHDHVDSNTSK